MKNVVSDIIWLSENQWLTLLNSESELKVYVWTELLQLIKILEHFINVYYRLLLS